MKKFISLFLIVVIFITALSGCSKNDKKQSGADATSEDVIVEEIVIDKTSGVPSKNSEATVTSESEPSSQSMPSTSSVTSKPNSKDEKPITSKQESTSSNIKPSKCTHNYNDVKIEKTAKLFEAGEKKYTCTNCGDSYTNTYPVEKIKILSLGNSYSLNSMWELYSICKQAGVKEIDIAIMYIGGCSLDKHWENVQNNAATYELYRNNNGEWKITKDYSIEKIITEQSWDIITLQNSSGMSGRSDGFANLENMANYVSDKCPSAKLLWHMTWGYQKGSKWLTPENYNGDEMLMYNSIVDCVKDIVVPSNKFVSVVPVGTAVMNARTSRLKTQVHQEDGSHLSEDVGYYVGAFTWFMHITGMSPYDFGYRIPNPSINENIDVFIECAQNAIDDPYQITRSY